MIFLEILGLSDTNNIQIHRAANPRLFDINPIDASEGIDDGLAPIDKERIGKTGGDDLHGHAGFDADAVELRPRLGRNQESGHSVIRFGY